MEISLIRPSQPPPSPSAMTCQSEETNSMQRVKLEVNVKETMLAEDAKRVCLAFIAAGDGEGAILGNLMQRTVQVVHDVEGRRIGFGPGTCA
ncbi:hypothetical protein LWI28_008888 [Acer negundo]|uniref:Xylanase inhibitor C-terminal domain-containing protein n=1 Tax=Acer negundo TaxID=4023 RepID=A0AAD5J8P8_ACENE|nr:hypothetical protein LWI28_008888 [Acer negundo]